MSVSEGDLLRSPAPDARTTSNLGHYLAWLETDRTQPFDTYDDLWRWSVQQPSDFWQSIWDYTGIVSDTPAGQALDGESIDDAVWWPTARVNYARHVLVDAWRSHDDRGNSTALIGLSQTREPLSLTWNDLREQVARARAGLVRLGVTRDSVVGAYLPNIPETVVAYLATVSLGAVWVSVAPDMGVRGTLDRLAVVEPSVLFAVAGYGFAGAVIDRADDVAAIRAGLPSLRHVVEIPYAGAPLPDTTSWQALTEHAAPLEFEPVPFDHPMVVLFTSGTTGRPKALVHRHGGLLVEHLKLTRLMWDLGPDDRVLNAVSTSWMAWNAVLSGLLARSAVVLHDGSPVFPDLAHLWRVADQWQVTLMLGVPAWLAACDKTNTMPCDNDRALSHLRTFIVASAPLPVSGAVWLHTHLPDHVTINVFCGGTETCTAQVGGNPLLPFRAGQMSARCLGTGVEAFDANGQPIVDELGEMVITTPLPSMPIGLWGDDGSGLFSEYLSMYPNAWRLGDWVRFTATGASVVTGRSDATLNRGGVRLGTVEFYGVVESLAGIADSLVVHIEDAEGGPGEILLFVVPSNASNASNAKEAIDDESIRQALRSELSPRHVPDRIVPMPVVPRNRSGKRLEVPVKRLLVGSEIDLDTLTSTLTDPAALDPYVAFAADYRAH